MRKIIKIKTVAIDSSDMHKKDLRLFDMNVNNLLKDGFELYSINSTSSKGYISHIATLIKYEDEY